MIMKGFFSTLMGLPSTGPLACLSESRCFYARFKKTRPNSKLPHPPPPSTKLKAPEPIKYKRVTRSISDPWDSSAPPTLISKMVRKEEIFPYPARNRLSLQDITLGFSEHRLCLVLQTNNLNAMGMSKMRSDLKALDVKLKYINAQIFRVFLATDPDFNSLVHVVRGPLMMASTNAAPSSLVPALNLIQSEQKLLLLFAKIENSIFTPEALSKFVRTSEPLSTLQKQALGTLSAVSSQVVGSIQTPMLELCSILRRHEEKLAGQGESPEA